MRVREFVRKVKKAYKQMNLEPVSKKFVCDGKVCALTAIALESEQNSKETNPLTLRELEKQAQFTQQLLIFRSVDQTLNSSFDFLQGVIDGFDGESLYLAAAINKKERRNGYNCGREAAIELGLDWTKND